MIITEDTKKEDKINKRITKNTSNPFSFTSQQPALVLHIHFTLHVLLKGVYCHSIMKSLRESDAAQVNTQSILGNSFHELCFLCPPLSPPPFTLNNEDAKPH